MNDDPHVAASLTPAQAAAVAKLACGISRPGGVALLCGPQGVGKTTVLAHLAAAERLRHLVVERRDVESWNAPPGSARPDLPDVVIADDAHLADEGRIARLLAACRSRRPAASLVLAGEGRLLTLVARDSRVEQAIHLRTSLRPMTFAEARGLLAGAMPGNVTDDSLDPALATIHEIAAGIPAAMLRLAGLATVIAASRPDGRLEPTDVEAIHRRLSPLAA